MPGVSDRQIEQARNTDMIAFFEQRHGFKFTNHGGDYRCKQHPSLAVKDDRLSWYWHSRGVGGFGATDYLIKVQGYDFVEAVKHLTDGGIGQIHQNTHPPPKVVEQKTAKPFVLPPANVNNDRAIAYLRGRGIDKDIIKQCIDAGTLYESNSHSVIFVGFDENIPKFACERGTTDNTKKDVFGSNKEFSFCLPPEKVSSSALMCCEAPVDILSHATICKMAGHRWDGHRLSLDGVGSAALIGFLERHPEITSVQFSLDNDKAGKDATNRIIKELLSDKRFSHLKITVAPAPLGKDFNDTLQAIHQLNKEKSKPDRQQAANLL